MQVLGSIREEFRGGKVQSWGEVLVKTIACIGKTMEASQKRGVAYV